MSISNLLFAGKYANLTSFFSFVFCAVFLPACLIAYALVPQKWKKYYLLLASYGFFWLISGELLVYLLITTLCMYCFGIWIDRLQKQMEIQMESTNKEGHKAIQKGFQVRQRRVLTLSILILITALIVVKYSGFFTRNLNTVMESLGLQFRVVIPKFVMPVGISFFTLQAVSYIIDVYRGIIQADRNIFRIALFISFFPQIVEGPICRYRQTADQLWNVGQISYSNLTLGLQRILYGMMKKIVVADRLNPLVETIFDNYTEYSGNAIALGAVCYTIQLYMDFSGSMDAVMGTAQIFGVTLPENFKRPFFSKTISEFWKRWHITLGSWFKDYVFYTVTTAKKMGKLTTSARKKIGNYYGPVLSSAIALFCVWICNGLWHGAAWSYVFFGMYHFALILIGILIQPMVRWINKKLHINPKHLGYRIFQTIRTMILVIIGELFFRANGLWAGLSMFRSMIKDFSLRPIGEEVRSKLGVDQADFLIVAVTVLIVFAISLLQEKGVVIRKELSTKKRVIRWGVLYAFILFIVIFGAYGREYLPVDPLYANF